MSRFGDVNQFVDLAQPLPPENFTRRALMSSILGDEVKFSVPATTNRVTVSTSVRDGSGWPSGLVLTLQRSNDDISWFPLSTPQTFTGEANITGIVTDMAFYRAVVTTVSSTEANIIVSNYAYTEYA